MNTCTNPNRQKAAATYNAAADTFDAPQLGFWNRHGQKAVELARLEPGQRVLDVGCGTGSSSLPAAAAVGPAGDVDGIDIAEAMLDRARKKASVRGIKNVRFRVGDMSERHIIPHRYDAVISVFSLFFVPDMERQVQRLWDAVERGGRLVVTVWGPNAFQPAADVFAEELHKVRPDIPPLNRPWERLTDPENLHMLFVDAIRREPEIIPVNDRQPLTDAAHFWTVAMGSGYRREIDMLTTPQQELVKTRMIRRLADTGAHAVETNAIHAVVRRPI